MIGALAKFDSNPDKRERERSTPNVMGRILNSSMSSIQSDNRAAQRSHNEFKQPNKLQEDLEAHVKYQTKKIESELSGEWSEILEQCLNEELFQAEHILLEEVENFVLKNMQENYIKIRQKLFENIEETYRAKGYKIPPTDIPLNFSPSIDLGKPCRGQRSLEKIYLESDDLYFDSASTDPNDIRLEVVKFIENSIENMASKFERISSEVISKEIPARISKMKNLIAADIKEIIENSVLVVKKNIDLIAEERVNEITGGGGGGRSEKSFKESHSNSYVVPEKSFKHKYEENYEFIENLASNYSGYSKTPHESHSLSGSFAKEPRVQNKKNEKLTPKGVPRTEAAALLQQFLKNK